MQLNQQQTRTVYPTIQPQNNIQPDCNQIINHQAELNTFQQPTSIQIQIEPGFTLIQPAPATFQAANQQDQQKQQILQPTAESLSQQPPPPPSYNSIVFDTSHEDKKY